MKNKAAGWMEFGKICLKYGGGGGGGGAATKHYCTNDPTWT